MMSDPEAYHPLNSPKFVADDVWVVDARMPGNTFEMPIRMTVLRVGSELILHSPTPYNRALHEAVEALGTIRHLLAPNVAHWVYLKQWQDAVPDAKTWAVAGLATRSQVRKSGLRIDEELSGTQSPFGPEIEAVYVSGPAFREVELFHRPSRTLVLTDLVINLEPGRMSFFALTMSRLLGILAPDGRAAIYVRYLLKWNGTETGRAARRLVALAPERVIFSHGKWFDKDAAGKLRHSLRWLTGDGPEETDFFSHGNAWIPALLTIGAAIAGVAIWRHRRRTRRAQARELFLRSFPSSRKARYGKYSFWR